MQRGILLSAIGTALACSIAWWLMAARQESTPLASKSFSPSAALEKEHASERMAEPIAPGRFSDGESFPIAPSLSPRLELGSEPLTWERRVEAVTAATDIDDAAKGRQLLNMIPTLPEEALDAVSRQAVEHLPDKAYAAARERLINPQTHAMVLSVLFGDLLERPDNLTLPVLLTIARTPAHPFAAQARENLELLLGINFGADWVKWDAEIRRALSTQR